jgi:hypothetical protein
MGDLLEPWMIQGLLGSNTLGWVVDKYLGKEIQELLEELVASRDNLLKVGC